MATITITLSDAATEQLEKMARRAGVAPEEFLRATVEDELAHEAERDYSAARSRWTPSSAGL